MEGGQSSTYLRQTRVSSGLRVSVTKTYRDEMKMNISARSQYPFLFCFISICLSDALSPLPFLFVKFKWSLEYEKLNSLTCEIDFVNIQRGPKKCTHCLLVHISWQIWIAGKTIWHWERVMVGSEMITTNLKTMPMVLNCRPNYSC